MSSDLSTTLAELNGRGYVIAPAGFGKTHLIAKSVSISKERQLVLTHTFAGVDAIKKKMRLLGVCPSKYHVDTIASWSLRTSLYFPKTAGWENDSPEGEEWKFLYQACERLVRHDFVQHIIRCSYGGLYVDEYQDCSVSQHSLIEALANALPCRILGDPMQAIFDFKDELVNWEKHIYPYFEKQGELTTPWRWELSGAHELGAWLVDVRKLLENEKAFSLTDRMPEGVECVKADINDFSNPARLKKFSSLSFIRESVISIFGGDARSKASTHRLAQSLGGRFVSLEELEGKDVQNFVKRLESARTNEEKLVVALDLLKACCTGLGSVLANPTKKAKFSKISKSTRFPDISLASNKFLDSGDICDLSSFLNCVVGKKDVHVYRLDLFNRAYYVLKLYEAGDANSLLDAYSMLKMRLRQNGRQLRHNKLIATTLLVKGLEFDHAIVVNPNGMSARQLYVALTRGSKSLTLITLKTQLPSS